MTTRRTGPSSLRILYSGRYLGRLFAACTLAAAIQGCYTLVRHPGIPELNYVRPPSDSPCIQCHSADQRLAYVSSQRLERGRGPWGTLAHPWWFHSADASVDSTRSDDAQER
ncbi:MAG TPA: hypothetical protein VFH33_04305 [Candidatus Krumholzibacteria bacterium]|nr:hypothetical protein [Candidatus Krumholzibacteria bacterium]